MSFLVNLHRVIKSGFLNFWRNGVVSLASILVYTVALFIIVAVFLGSAVFGATLEQIKDKVDITVYFKLDSLPADMERLADNMRKLPEVKEVILKDESVVLAEFKETHANEPLILQSLDELDGVNPLRAELNIKASDPSEYVSIHNYLQNESPILDANTKEDIIDKINFDDNADTIKRFTSVTKSVERLGLVLSILAAFIAILVAFNTIRLAIYTSREEISVMRLVGADDNYIRGPFIVEGILYGIVASLFTIALYYPITKWVSGTTENFYGGINLFDYYINNLPYLLLITIALGILLGIIASTLAVRRYLKV